MQNNGKMRFVKGLGAGMIAGAAAVVVGKAVMKEKHNVAKGSSKMVKAVGQFVDGIHTMIH